MLLIYNNIFFIPLVYKCQKRRLLICYLAIYTYCIHILYIIKLCVTHLEMFNGAYVVFIYHRWAEGELADATERHQEPFHSAVRVGKVVRVARGAVVESAHQAEGGASCQLRAGSSLQLALRRPLRHAHAQQLHLVPPRHTRHGRAVPARHQVLSVCLPHITPTHIVAQ